MAYVRYTCVGRNPMTVSLLKDVTIIGRSAQADITLADDNSSRQHCQIRKWAGKFIIEDLQRKNGTFVNGNKIAGEQPLNDGDLISVGDTQIVFKVK